MTANHSAIDHYNALVRELERNGEVFDAVNRYSGFSQEKYKQPTAKELLRLVEHAPVYVFDDVAADRARKTALDSKTWFTPTMPENGVTLASPSGAIFVRSAVQLRGAFSTPDYESSGYSFNDVYEYVFAVRVPPDDPAASIASTMLCSGISTTERSPLGEMESRCVKTTAVCELTDGYQTTSVNRAEDGSTHSKLVRVRGKIAKELPAPDGYGERVLRDASTALALALVYLHFVDQPAHYVVEERPAHVPEDRGSDGKTPKKATRYNDRERWVILDPEAVRRRFLDRSDTSPVGEHASPVPHLRRSHTRTLRSDRYKFRKGSIINIRPMWVGERNWANGRMKYRVVSRPGATENQA